MDASLQGVIEYISQCVSQGVPEETIKAQLVTGGWSEDLVNRGFELYHQPTQPAEPVPSAPPQPIEELTPAVNPHPLSATPIKKRGLKKYLTKQVLVFGGAAVLALVVILTLVSLISKPVQKTNTQNTQHANDASAIWGGAEKFAGSHKGVWPQSVSAGPAANSLDICGIDCNDPNKVTVTLHDVTAADVSFKEYAGDLKVPNITTIYIVTNASCKPDKSGIGDSNAGQKFSFISVLYAVKSGSGIKQQCVS